MFRFIYKFFLIFLTIISLSIIYLSYFGVETKRFDELIKNKANDINRFIKLDFNNTKIYLNPLKLNLLVRLQDPKIYVSREEIDLSKLDLFIPLGSFLTTNFILQRSEIAFSKNDIKDLVKISNIFVSKIFNKKLNKIFHKGSLQGKFVIPFNKDGTVGKEYGFVGKISDASINISKELMLRNFTTEINHKILNNGDIFIIKVKKGSVYDLELNETEIKLNRNPKVNNFKNLLRTKGNLNFNQIKKIAKLLNFNLNNLKEIDGYIDLSTKIDFSLTKQFKIKNLKYFSEGVVNNAKIKTTSKNNIKKYLPDYNQIFFLKETKIKLSNLKGYQSAEFAGLIKVKDSFDNFEVKEFYHFKDKSYNFKGNFNLTNTKINISSLNYQKGRKKKSELSFDIKFKSDKYLIIKNLNFIENKTAIFLSNIHLNKTFEIYELKKIKIKTFR